MRCRAFGLVVVMLLAYATNPSVNAQNKKQQGKKPPREGDVKTYSPEDLNRAKELPPVLPLNPLAVLSIQSVRDELQVEKRQAERLRSVILGVRALAEQERKLKSKKADAKPETKSVEQLKAAHQRTAFMHVQKAWEYAEGVLSPDQIVRLEEISLQLQGPVALMREEIAVQLELSDRQRDKLAEVRKEASSREIRRVQKLFAEKKLAREQLRGEINKAKRKAEESLLDVLTASQRAGFRKMQGKPFQVATGK